MPMDIDDELSLITKRRKELEDITNDLEDVLDWFKKNIEQMQSSIIYEDLSRAISDVDDLIIDLECNETRLKQMIAEEQS
jgi:DNA repair exonuclease SbcCD ATPase subunit